MPSIEKSFKRDRARFKRRHGMHVDGLTSVHLMNHCEQKRADEIAEKNRKVK